MKKEENSIRLIQSISELHHYLGLPQPQHPLITVLHLEQLKAASDASVEKMNFNF